MQAGNAARGVGTIPGRGRQNALLTIAAVLVFAAALALAMWVVPIATSGVCAEDAVQKAGAGSAVVHDDAGNMPTDAGLDALRDGAGSAVIHDDAGNMPR
jgi:hypothetical protein